MNQVRPAYYGGPSNPYEPIKVIEAWDLDFKLGNCVKYIARYKKKSKKTLLLDLKKAATYLDMKIKELEFKDMDKFLHSNLPIDIDRGADANKHKRI